LLIGGVFALCALLTEKSINLKARWKNILNIISILAASLLIGMNSILNKIKYLIILGDGALTPAVSVLSAIEGLALNAPNLHQWVVPITVVIILCLFIGQQWGTSKIAYVFAPIMLIWFIALFSIGIWRITFKIAILKSFNPYEAIYYLIREKRDGFYQIGKKRFLILKILKIFSGGVFLSVTGCEALFADLGKINCFK
jgi:KUP system potassium uptake protein